MLKHGMILFVQRKTRVYKYHSFIQQEHFFHSFKKYMLAFPSVPGTMLALWVQQRQSLHVQGNFSILSHSCKHTPCQNLSNNLSKGGH
jgi:hypothetical protein